jgi:hypothetical protein
VTSLRVGIGSIFFLFSLGCSASQPTLPDSPATLPAEVASQEKQERPPFEMELLEDVNDGQHVYVRGRIQVHTVWPLEEVAFRLTSYSQGERLESKMLPLSAVLRQSGALVRGETRDFEVHMPVRQANEYQLELVWGNEARQSLQSQAVLALELRDVRSEYRAELCQQEPCPQRAVVHGKLYNVGPVAVVEARLGVSIHWVSDEGPSLDLGSRIPENEELVEVANLNLQVGSEQPFSLEIERTLPVQPGGRYEPFVRVLPLH